MAPRANRGTPRPSAAPPSPAEHPDIVMTRAVDEAFLQRFSEGEGGRRRGGGEARRHSRQPPLLAAKSPPQLGPHTHTHTSPIPSPSAGFAAYRSGNWATARAVLEETVCMRTNRLGQPTSDGPSATLLRCVRARAQGRRRCLLLPLLPLGGSAAGRCQPRRGGETSPLAEARAHPFSTCPPALPHLVQVHGRDRL